MMFLVIGEIDGVVGGLNYLIVDILRVVFKVIGFKLGIKIILLVMIMYKEEKFYFFSDILVNFKFDLNGLVDIVSNVVEFVKIFIDELKVVFLSFLISWLVVIFEIKLVVDVIVEFNKVY